MKQFAFSVDCCRVNIMLEYFGEKPQNPCGKCDYCRQTKQVAPSDDKVKMLKESIIYMASQPKGHKISYFISNSIASQQETIEMIRTLLDEAVLILDTDGETIKCSV